VNAVSLASYIGTNIEIPTDIEREDLYTEEFWIGDCFSSKYTKDDVKKTHFTTSYVYEISSHWGIELYNNASRSKEALQKLELLIFHMRKHLNPGDYFELYSCWIGEETEKRNGSINVLVDELNWHTVEIPEKTLITFQF
jgi:hypothetical protein